MKKLVALVLAVPYYACADSLDNRKLQEIREASLEEVPALISVHKQEQETYKVFYSAFLEELSMLSTSRCHKQVERALKWAKSALHDKHPGYYHELEKQGQFDPKLQTSSTRAFLARYAVYQKMCAAQDQHSILKDMVIDYSNKVAVSLTKATRSLKEWLLS